MATKSAAWLLLLALALLARLRGRRRLPPTTHHYPRRRRHHCPPSKPPSTPRRDGYAVAKESRSPSAPCSNLSAPADFGNALRRGMRAYSNGATARAGIEVARSSCCHRTTRHFPSLSSCTAVPSEGVVLQLGYRRH